MLIGQRVILRSLERADLSTVATWRNDPMIHPFFFDPYPISLSDQDRWYDNYLGQRKSLIFVITLKEAQRCLGLIGLDQIDHRNQCAEYGRLLIANPADRGKGYAADATDTLLNYGFLELNLNRIFLRVFADNTKALGLYEHCGFQREGLERQALFSGGRFRDLVLMSMLRSEFLSARSGHLSI